MAKSWQEVIRTWPKWVESTHEARRLVVDKYGDITAIIGKAKLSDKPNGNKGGLLSINKEMWQWWAIENELEDIGSEFITNEMGLVQDTDLFDTFRQN